MAFDGIDDYVSLPQVVLNPTEVTWGMRLKSNVSDTTEQRLLAYNNDGVFFITSINSSIYL